MPVAAVTAAPLSAKLKQMPRAAWLPPHHRLPGPFWAQEQTTW